MSVVAEIHGYQYLIGHLRGFRRSRPQKQTQGHREGRQLLDEPGELDIDWKSILAGRVSAIRDVLEKQGEERANCHEYHEVSHEVQNMQLLFIRREQH